VGAAGSAGVQPQHIEIRIIMAAMTIIIRLSDFFIGSLPFIVITIYSRSGVNQRKLHRAQHRQKHRKLPVSPKNSKNHTETVLKIKKKMPKSQHLQGFSAL
jgi:hypothetical protein